MNEEHLALWGLASTPQVGGRDITTEEFEILLHLKGRRKSRIHSAATPLNKIAQKAARPLVFDWLVAQSRDGRYEITNDGMELLERKTTR